MKIPRAQIAHVVADRTLARRFTKKDVESLAAYLLEEGRTGELDSLLRDIQVGWADRGYVEVIATSAHELSAQAAREIEAKAKHMFPDAKRIVVTRKLEPNLIGGMQLRIVDYQLDASVTGELQKFKTTAMQGKD